MFERFTADARAAVADAMAVAPGWIGREHLVIGLAGAGEPTLRAAGFTREQLVAALAEFSSRAAALGEEDDAEALRAIGIDLAAIRSAVDRDLGPSAWDAGAPDRRRPQRGMLGRLLPDRRPFTSEARKALELALREAIADGSRELTPTHVLRGLLRDPGPAATALIETRMPVAQLRARATGSAPAA